MEATLKYDNWLICILQLHWAATNSLYGNSNETFRKKFRLYETIEQNSDSHAFETTRKKLKFFAQEHRLNNGSKRKILIGVLKCLSNVSVTREQEAIEFWNAVMLMNENSDYAWCICPSIHAAERDLLINDFRAWKISINGTSHCPVVFLSQTTQ